ncbi:MAG: hypothetical protein PHT47_03880 [Candidatus Cloacimonetes bacterium]|jgi:hypothetical protein|nr:hypothetical protein [Candidatus Cloacimonadota bacterium]
MKRVFEYHDEHLGKSYIVIDKIRELRKTLGELVITFDNGEKRVLSVEDPNATLKALVDAIEQL